MKKYSFKGILTAVVGLVGALVLTAHVSAMTPTLSLVNNGYGAMQVTVYGDANAPIILDYYSGGQLLGAGVIGYTNYSGYFNGSLDQNTYYAIPNGSQVLVYVNGQQSGTVTWQGNGGYYNNNQYPYNNGTLTFSQTNVSLAPGQSQTVYINGNNYNNGYAGQYVVSSDLSSGVVSAILNGNALTLYGQNNGSMNITICSSSNGYYNTGNGCGTLYVTVTGSNYNNYNTYPTYPTCVYPYCNNNIYNYGYQYNNYNYPLTVSNSNVQLNVGSTATVTISGGYNNYYNNSYNYNYNYGSGNYYILNNGSSIASSSITGSTLSIYGMTAGTTNVTVCQTGGSSGCATVNVVVNGYYPPYNNGNWYWNTYQHCWLQR